MARSHGIPYPAFCNWIRRDGQAGAGGRATAGIEFEEIRLPNPGPAVPGAATAPWEAGVRWPSGLVVALAPGVAAARVRGWVEQAAVPLKPVYLAMRDRHRTRSHPQVDETPARCLNVTAPNGTRRGYFWVHLDPEAEVPFQWSEGRAHDAPREFLGSYRGILQVDGLSADEALVKSRSGEVSLSSCWAHARRAIVEARAEAPRVAPWPWPQIQAMMAAWRSTRIWSKNAIRPRAPGRKNGLFTRNTPRTPDSRATPFSPSGLDPGLLSS